jgi:hypothetical protein
MLLLPPFAEWTMIRCCAQPLLILEEIQIDGEFHRSEPQTYQVRSSRHFWRPIRQSRVIVTLFTDMNEQFPDKPRRAAVSLQGSLRSHLKKLNDASSSTATHNGTFPIPAAIVRSNALTIRIIINITYLPLTP